MGEKSQIKLWSMLCISPFVVFWSPNDIRLKFQCRYWCIIWIHDHVFQVDDFLQALVSCDKEHIHESCLNVVKQEYLKNPEFHPDLVRTKSTAAAGLCAWTINIVRYYEVR